MFSVFYESLFLKIMQPVHTANILVENRTLLSVFLEREVKIDFFLPKNVADPSAMSLLLILIVLLVLLGGGGFYAGGPRVGISLGGLILIIIVIMAVTGRL